MRFYDRVNKIWLLLSVGVILMLYMMYSINFHLGLETLRSSKLNAAWGIIDSGYPKRLNRTAKKILFWNTMFGDEGFYFGSGDIFEHCPGLTSNCYATHSRSMFNIVEFDAVMFHGSELSLIDLPLPRSDHQRYVFVNLESPENRPILYPKFENDFFNITMTYRLDSDVAWPYGDIRELDSGNVVAPSADVVWRTRFNEATGSRTVEKSMEVDKFSKTRGKSKAAIWFVSNCNSHSGREKYVEELAENIDVYIFGKCGTKVGCSKDRDCFREVVEPDYYFYLSFENSLCQDYVTEKLYFALKYNVVPVVYGGANYSQFAPPKSYINALDFANPRALARYLKKLMREPHEYEKYFEWKKLYATENPNKRVICQLCRYLHEPNAPKTYSPLSAWYKTDKCPLQDDLRNGAGLLSLPDKK